MKLYTKIACLSLALLRGWNLKIREFHFYIFVFVKCWSKILFNIYFSVRYEEKCEKTFYSSFCHLSPFGENFEAPENWFLDFRVCYICNYAEVRVFLSICLFFKLWRKIWETRLAHFFFRYALPCSLPSVDET